LTKEINASLDYKVLGLITEGGGIDALVVVFVVFAAAVGGQLVHDEVNADVDTETLSDVVCNV
jgi:hypothetical protein